MINKITNYIHLSGKLPFYENDAEYFRRENIKFIICCIRDFNREVHQDFIEQNNLDISILYLPFKDNISQNLWYPTLNKPEWAGTKLDSFYWLEESNKPSVELASNVIDYATLHKQGVLVHCRMGRSRAASVVIYWLMKRWQLDYEEAYFFVKSRRQEINPNRAFITQLQFYDHNRRKSNFYTIQELLTGHRMASIPKSYGVLHTDLISKYRKD